MMSSVKIKKEEVKNSFNKASKTYDLFASLQKDVAEKLLNSIDLHLSNKVENKILDIGCGTGFVTKNLKIKHPKDQIYAIDLAHNMALETFNKTKTNVLTGDMDDLPFKDSSFNLITSSLCYQWTCDLGKSFLEAHRTLKKDGSFYFTTFTKGTLKELNSSINEVTQNNNLQREEIIFSQEDEIIETLEKTGFKNIEIKKEQITTYHDDIFHLLKSLKSIGATGPARIKENNLSTASVIKKANEYYKENFTENNKIKATYEVLLVKAGK